jgi:hypothetical protein
VNPRACSWNLCALYIATSPKVTTLDRSNANGNVGGPGWTNGATVGSCLDPNVNASAVYPNCPDRLFQYHHQAFNYFASFAPGTAQRPIT